MKTKPSNIRLVTAILLVGICLLVTPALAAKKPFRADVNRKLETLRAPFIKNEGQLQGEVAFQAKTFGGSLFVTCKGDIVYTLSKKTDNRPARVVIKETLTNARQQTPKTGRPGC